MPRRVTVGLLLAGIVYLLAVIFSAGLNAASDPLPLNPDVVTTGPLPSEGGS